VIGAVALPPNPKHEALHMSRLRVWYGELSNIDKFTFIVAIFTGLLCIVAALQYLAFIHSERPFLTTSEILMDNGEPSTDRQFSAQIFFKNSGKHVAVVMNCAELCCTRS
jgi:hypothetical protein